MKISLIISTYKSPDFLQRVLTSVSRQTVQPMEVIVTEDGEYEENKKLIKAWEKTLGVPLHHVTQKDIGNRKPLALNKAILKAQGEYLVFIDGDCIISRNFIKDHMKLADEKSFITGRRVELSQRASEHLTVDKIKTGYLDKAPVKLWVDAVLGETYFLGRMFRTPGFLRGILQRNCVFDIRGCNFSVHRKHMVSINGFDNTFSGAYGEDSDVEYRLKFHGLKMKSIKGAAIQYHLWHPTQIKDESNQRKLMLSLSNRIAKAADGLSQAIHIN